MLRFLLQTMFGSQEPNYYVISALLWMRSSLDSSLRGDWSDCCTSLQSLVLELRVLFEKKPAYINLGIFFEAAGLAKRLKKLEWREVDLVTGRPRPDVWKFDFVMTCTWDGQAWSLTAGVQWLPILLAVFGRRSWVVAVYSASEGTKDDRWYKPEKFELWSTKQSHIKFLLDEATNVGQVEKARRNSLCARLVRKESRSVEIDEDESLIPTTEQHYETD